MSKTKENLISAFAKEAQASLMYKFYAEIARNEGLEYYALIFDEAARNEESHAREMFISLGKFKNTSHNLRTAIDSEKYESEFMYPEFSETAISEGKLEAARIFKQIAKVETEHNQRFKDLLKLLNKKEVFKREKDIKWKCSVCGYSLESKNPPKKCPACRNGREKYIPEDFSF